MKFEVKGVRYLRDMTDILGVAAAIWIRTIKAEMLARVKVAP